MARIAESELVINPDGSVYHLNLRPEEIATNIITVGDPDRVSMVSKYFDEVEVRKAKREFVSHTGRIGQKRLTVLSTGIGPDNIDIAINEIDALANIDFESRKAKEQLISMNFVRIGTSGSLHPEVPVDSFVAGAYGLGLDNLISFYDYKPNLGEAALEDELKEFMEYAGKVPFYACEGSPALLSELGQDKFQGITITSPGFYAPQGRELRARARYGVGYFKSLAQFKFRDYSIMNFEMETSAIYGLSRLLGHRALSTNAIIANRPNGAFSKDPYKAVDKLIQNVLSLISSSPLF